MAVALAWSGVRPVTNKQDDKREYVAYVRAATPCWYQKYLVHEALPAQWLRCATRPYGVSRSEGQAAQGDQSASVSHSALRLL